MKSSKAHKTIIIVFISLGLVFIAIAGISYLRTKLFLSRCEVTRGKVVGFVRGYKGVLNPIISFKTKNGKTIQFKESFGTRPSHYEKGKIVCVLYDPEKPTCAKIDSFLYLWFVDILFVFLGLMFCLLATTWFIVLRKKVKSAT